MADESIKIKERETKNNKFTAKDLAYTALMTVVTAICSWISLNMVVPFTLQTFGVFCALCLLGGKRGFFSVLVYLILGAAGVPVFAGFSGGIGAFLTPSGGYLFGFLATAAVYWAITEIFGNKLLVTVIALILGLAACYAIGTVWFTAVYSQNTGKIGLAAAFSWCVLPFLIPDGVKMALAVLLTRRLSKYV